MIKFFIPSLLLTSLCFAAENIPNNAGVLAGAGVPPKEDRWFLEADFLYWVANQEGNAYASTGSAITVPGTTDPAGVGTPQISNKGYLYSPDSRMKPGFRLGAGLNIDHDNWDTYAQYAFFFDKANGKISSTNLNAGILPIFAYTPNNSILTNTTAYGGTTGFISKASSYWSLRMNNINWELGKNMPIGEFFFLHPHFGLEASFQKQQFNAYYTVTSLTDFSDTLGSNKVLFEQNFWGVGLRAGVDSIWKCIDHFSLYFNTAVAGLWGQFSTQARSYDTNVSLSYSNVLIANTVYSPHKMSPVLELALGVQGNWTFKNRVRLLLKAGYEEQIWFYQNQHSSTIADTSLVLQGLTINCRIDF
jgi:hypothetical protein